MRIDHFEMFCEMKLSLFRVSVAIFSSFVPITKYASQWSASKRIFKMLVMDQDMFDWSEDKSLRRKWRLNYVLCFAQILSFADYRQATSIIMHFVTFLIFKWFLSDMLLKFYFIFYDRTDMENSFCFNRFYLVNILLMFISCVNIRK